MKNDKSKRERAEKSASTAKGKAKEGATDSASASTSLPTSVPSKAKGKEKASASASASGTMLPPPFTSVPRPISVPVSTDAEQPMTSAAAFWRAEEDVEDEEMDVEDESGAVDEDDVEDLDIDDEVEVGDEVQDMMSVEEEELRKDVMALEEHTLVD